LPAPFHPRSSFLPFFLVASNLPPPRAIERSIFACQCHWEDNSFNDYITAKDRRAFTLAAYDSQGYLAPGFDLDYPYQPSPLYSASTASDLTLGREQQFTPPNYHISDISPPPSKRQRKSDQFIHIKKERNTLPQMTVDGAADAADTAAASKPKRVRTGCLTCRERHLKCDEGLPNCQNCRKSTRVCKRGVRLNFIDTQVKNPPLMPPTADWRGTTISWFQITSSNIL